MTNFAIPETASIDEMKLLKLKLEAAIQAKLAEDKPAAVRRVRELIAEYDIEPRQLFTALMTKSAVRRAELEAEDFASRNAKKFPERVTEEQQSDVRQIALEASMAARLAAEAAVKASQMAL